MAEVDDIAGGNDFFRAILDHAPWGAIVAATDLEGPCEYINPEFTRITGYELADLPTVQAWVERAYPDRAYRQTVLENWADDVHPDNMRRDVVYAVTCRDGRVRRIQFRAAAFGPTRMIVMLLDRSDAEEAAEQRALLETRMHQKEKLESLGVLAAGVAHDSNNLLVGILGNADLALMELRSGTAAYAKVESIKDTARRAADLAGQLHAYAGEEAFAPETVDLRDVLDQIRPLLESAVSKKTSLRFEFEDFVPAVRADPRQLRQVMLNLVTNASEALGGESGTVTLAAGAVDCDAEQLEAMSAGPMAEPGLHCFLEVTDTGRGFGEDLRDRLFDPFFTTKSTGSGLGLASVLGIVRSHGGAIDVSGAPGQGACFRILLPAHEQDPSDGHADPEDLSGWFGRGTVLLVDDEAMVRDVARAMLERAGFDVLTAQDGYEAVEIFRDHGDDCCCVVADLAMPRMNGEETFRELRTLDPGVRVVLTSGYDEQEASARFSGSGLAAYVQKPYTYTRLIGAVRGALGRS